MSIEIELKKMLEENGWQKKETKGGSFWTYEHKIFKVVNHHNDGSICFNYLQKYVKNKTLSSLPFYSKIANITKINKKNYAIISKEVEIDVLNEIVEFIISDSGAGKRDPQQSTPVIKRNGAYLPTKDYVLIAIEQVRSELKENTGTHAPINYDAILDQVEKNAINDDKSLKLNWRKTTEEMLDDWS
jgi:predicted RNA binding protein YcfA (HicA-like mRNA interferase family)